MRYLITFWPRLAMDGMRYLVYCRPQAVTPADTYTANGGAIKRGHQKVPGSRHIRPPVFCLARLHMEVQKPCVHLTPACTRKLAEMREKTPFPFLTEAWKAEIQDAAWRPSSSLDVDSGRSRKGNLPYMRAAEEV